MHFKGRITLEMLQMTLDMPQMTRWKEALKIESIEKVAIEKTLNQKTQTVKVHSSNTAPDHQAVLFWRW